MKFINLTPHEISVDKDAVRISIPSTGDCRVAVKAVDDGDTLEILNEAGMKFKVPLVRNNYGDIEGLPKQEPDTVYIVSLIVLNALKTKGRLGYRPDVVAPDTGKTAIREDGKIIAVTQFVQN